MKVVHDGKIIIPVIGGGFQIVPVRFSFEHKLGSCTVQVERFTLQFDAFVATEWWLHDENGEHVADLHMPPLIAPGDTVVNTGPTA